MATASKKAAPVAAKKETPAAEEAQLEVGSKVRFMGYGPDVADEDKVLVEGEVYDVAGFMEPDGEDPGGDPIVAIPNPDFNAKKKEHPDNNPKTLEVQVFKEEVELVDESEEAEEAEEGAEEEAVVEKPAKVAAKPAKAAAAPAKGKAVAAPAKGKAAAAPAKGKAVKAAEPKPEPEVVPDILDTVLENEDAEVIALVEGSEDLIATAQELESRAASTEYQFGGVLYHIRKDKKYLEVEGGETYGETGGFEKFLIDYFNIEYRKAMYLIKIYVAFNVAGIEDASNVVATMGWTKAMKIAPLMLVDGQKSADLIELANSSTVSDLSTAIMEAKRIGGSPGEIKQRLTLRFRFWEEEAASVNAILEAAKEQLSLKTLEEVLSHIVQEWATEHGGAPATKDKAPVQKAAPAKKAVGSKRVAMA